MVNRDKSNVLKWSQCADMVAVEKDRLAEMIALGNNTYDKFINGEFTASDISPIQKMLADNCTYHVNTDNQP